jgi:hypothetical protein
VYLPEGETTTPTLALLDSTPGFTRVRDWTYAIGSTRLYVVAYGVDMAAVSFDSTRTLAEAEGMQNLAQILHEVGATDAAAALAARIVPTPDTVEARSALDALRSIGGTPSP